MRRGFALVLVASALAAACSPAGSSSPSSSAPGADEGSDAEARQYCTEQGGELVDRIATWNTNADPPQWLELAGRMTFCEFESGEGHQTTRIAVDLTTLYSEAPTLAAVAYLSKIGPVVPEERTNPGLYNCNAGLGGAGAFGNTATGGGWVNTDEPIFSVMEMCVFADGSAIDAFGIFYYADDTVRGADLAPILRYQPGDRLPAMFEDQRR